MVRRIWNRFISDTVLYSCDRAVNFCIILYIRCIRLSKAFSSSLIVLNEFPRILQAVATGARYPNSPTYSRQRQFKYIFHFFSFSSSSIHYISFHLLASTSALSLYSLLFRHYHNITYSIISSDRINHSPIGKAHR